VKISSIISLRICGSSYIPYLILAYENEENLVHKYWKHRLFLSDALTNCIIIHSLMCKGGSRIFSRSARLTFETFWILVAVSPFRANVQFSNVCPWPCYPTRIGNRDILCMLFFSSSSNPMTLKSPYICHSCSWYLIFSCTNFNVSYDSDSFVECASGMEASMLLL